MAYAWLALDHGSVRLIAALVALAATAAIAHRRGDLLRQDAQRERRAAASRSTQTAATYFTAAGE